MIVPRALASGVLAVLAGLWDTLPAGALELQINYTDAADEGFNDPGVGPQRKVAFEFAAEIWAQTLAGTAPVVIDAAMDPLGGTGTGAVLGRTGATSVHRGFAGALPDTVYGAALANQLRRGDVNGAEVGEIQIVLNSDVDGPVALGSLSWYYGTDAEAGSDVDFVTVVLHELGHGLNFFDIIDPGSGQWLLLPSPGIFERVTMRPGVGFLADMRDAERLVAITSANILWSGDNVLAANGGPAPLYAPNPYQPGSSVSHWDTSFFPDELIEPFYTVPDHDLGLLLPALVDMGWQLAIPTPTEGPPTATPTPTPTRRPTFTPRPDATRRPIVYVANFDSNTVSVVDTATNQVSAIISVPAGPLGVAAAADGTRVFVASFHTATLSIINPYTNSVTATVSVGGSANSVAVTPDGAVALVTDTFSDGVAVVDTTTASLTTTVPVGPQPAGIAVSPDGRYAFVAEYGSNSVAVIDTRFNITSARIVLGPEVRGPLGIALDAIGRRGYVTSFFSRHIFGVDPRTFQRVGSFPPPVTVPPRRPEAVAFAPDGKVAYITTQRDETGAGEVLLVDTETVATTRVIAVGDVPEAIAVTPDGSFVYVANAASNNVSVIGTARNRVVATIPVGNAPMGVAVALVPEACVGDCDGDGVVAVDELVTGVRVALEEVTVDRCPSLDANGSGTATVGELVQATQHLLGGCE